MFKQRRARTVIHGNADGSHVVINREVLRGISGSSKERRLAQRKGITEEWIPVPEARVLYVSHMLHHRKDFAPGIEVLPLGSEEIQSQAMLNSAVAQHAILAHTRPVEVIHETRD